jgi:sialate O-acetylesterase
LARPEQGFADESDLFQTLVSMAMLQRSRWPVVLAMCCSYFPAAQGEDSSQGTSLLHALFQDHLVLQRDQPVNVWGSAQPGEEVAVFMAGREETVSAGARGHWLVTLPPMPPDGPYTLSVRTSHGAATTIEDVLVGDVFLCSGQSNMVLPVHRTLNSRAEIAAADNEDLRMLTVPPASSLSPLDEFTHPVEWQRATPDTVRDWSATCYYFARELQKEVQVPIGLVVSAYGGTGIRTWMSAAALGAMGDYAEELQILDLYTRDRSAALQSWGRVWEEWWRSRSRGDAGSEPWKATAFDEDVWAVAPVDLGPWEEWGVEQLTDFNGLVWYRTTVRLTTEQAIQPAVLSLGKIDEIDQTWVNGQPVGTNSGSGIERRYPLPAGLLQEGENLIVINVLDTWESGGLYGEMKGRGLLFSGGTEVALDGVWRYRRVPSELGWPPRAPWDPTGGMTTSYNAMIAPLESLAFRGVVWYQGESDTGDPRRYAGLLTGLMSDWRARFDSDLPFLIVQLANYGAPWTTPTESGWARLREAQRLVAAADLSAGLAVTLDLGDREDIHPANKQEVGKRLARVARRVVYGESIAASGPTGMRARLQGHQVAVQFDDVTQRLVAYGADGPIGFELCGASQESCRFARARIEDGNVLLTLPDGADPERVRYCWADSPVCTLYDESGLPAGPFELPVE